MTNQPIQQPQPQQPSESILTKIIDGFMWWIGSLTGKPPAKKQYKAVQNVPTAPNPDNPVNQDVEALKKLVGKFAGSVSSAVAPKLNKTIESSTSAANEFVKKAASDKGKIKNILKIIFLILIAVVVLFTVFKLFKSFVIDRGETNNPSVTVTPGANGSLTNTPTPVVFVPSKPSLYADDPVILKLEQDINILAREIAGTNIKETQLNSPILDYNISF